MNLLRLCLCFVVKFHRILCLELFGRTSSIVSFLEAGGDREWAKAHSNEAAYVYSMTAVREYEMVRESNLSHVLILGAVRCGDTELLHTLTHKLSWTSYLSMCNLVKHALEFDQMKTILWAKNCKGHLFQDVDAAYGVQCAVRMPKGGALKYMQDLFELGIPKSSLFVIACVVTRGNLNTRFALLNMIESTNDCRPLLASNGKL